MINFPLAYASLIAATLTRLGGGSLADEKVEAKYDASGPCLLVSQSLEGRKNSFDSGPSGAKQREDERCDHEQGAEM
jgi:hypothetical protein